jgi:hypothetical protein
VITDEQMDEALDVLESAIASVGTKPARGRNGHKVNTILDKRERFSQP